MKVNSTGNQTGSSPIQNRESSSTQSSKGSTDSRKSKLDPTLSLEKPDLSPRSKELAQAKSLAQSTPDVREDRVNELRRQIADGTYRVDAKDIADRLVDEHLESAELSA